MNPTTKQKVKDSFLMLIFATLMLSFFWALSSTATCQQIVYVHQGVLGNWPTMGNCNINMSRAINYFR